MEPTWYQGVLRKRAASLRKVVLGKGIPSSSSSALPACGPGRGRPESTEARPTSRLQQSSSEPALAAPTKARQVWRCVWKGKVGVRATPETDGERTGAILQHGDVFEVSAEHLGADGVRFLKLANDRGWVFETKAEVGTVCLRHEPEKEAQARAAERKEQAQEFNERQTCHRSVESRASLAKTLRQLNKDCADKEEADFLGAKGVVGFRSFLAKRFGSISAGWKAMDSEGRGHITFYEFCNICRKLGFHGNMRTLWKELDAKCHGSISLMELDPEAARYVDTFKQQLLSQYGSMATAWKEGLDTSGTGRVEEKDLTACCQKLGLDLSGKKLYKLLRHSPPRSNLGLTMADFDEQLAKKMELGEAIPAAPSKEGKEPAADAATRPREASAEAEAVKLGLHTPADFRRALVVRHGSLLAGWREAVDINGKGQVGFAEFCQALQRLSFQGDVRSMFRQLDTGDKGCIVFADLDKEADALLTDFRAKLTEVHGNTMLAWVKALDRKGAGCVTKQQFVRACDKVGFAGDAKRLFRILRPEVGRQNLTLKDFDPKAYHALTRGDFRMLSEAENPRKSGLDEGLLDMSFEDRQNSSLYLQLRKGWDASRRAEYAKACLEDVPAHAIDSAWEFEELCRRKFGSMVSAWRHGLDTDANGKLTFNEFCKQCRLLGYVGNLKSLWAGYGGVDQGYLTLKNLDPDADAMVSSFLNLLTDRYGTVDAAWRKGFGKDPHDSVDEQELGKVCQAIGYETSHKKLFRCLRRSAAHILLTVWDLDPSCRRSRRRGDIVYATEPKTAETFAGHQAHGGELLPESDALKKAAPKDAKGQPLTSCMRRAMANRHGSTVAAWRASCDTQECLDFAGFLRLLEDCNYGGLRKELWQEVAGDQTTVTFKDLDPDAQRALDRTREGLLGRFDTLTRAWHEGVDTEKAGRVDEATFAKVGEQLGFKHPKKVFWLLLSHQGQRSLLCEDLRPLLIGLTPEQQASAWGGGAENGPEGAPRVHMERLVEDFHGQDFLIASLDTFKQGLVVRFGSLFSAWRSHFDLNRNGVVSKAEFTKGCQLLGIKAVQRLWTDLDTSQRGFVALKEFDPEAGEAFGALEKALVEKYGSVHQGWAKCFELPDPPNKHVEQGKFARQCQALGVPGNPGKLFRLLRPEPGRKYLIYEDLWGAPSKKAGGKRATSAPKARSRPATTSAEKGSKQAEAGTAGQSEPSAEPEEGGAAEQEEEEEERPAHAADSAAPSPTAPASPAAAGEEALREAAEEAAEGGGAQEAGAAEEAPAPPPPGPLASGSVSPVAPPSTEDVDGDGFEAEDTPENGALNELAKPGSAEAGEDYDEFDASASGAISPNGAAAEEAAGDFEDGFEDDFEDDGAGAPSAPAAESAEAGPSWKYDFSGGGSQVAAGEPAAASPAGAKPAAAVAEAEAEAEPSYEDDFSKEEDSRAPAEEAEPSYEDDFSKEEDSRATGVEAAASSSPSEEKPPPAPSAEVEAAPSYEEDFSEEGGSATAAEDSPSPAGAAKPGALGGGAEVEPSYEDDFSQEGDSRAAADEPAASPAGAKPAAAAARVTEEAELSWKYDFSGGGSQVAVGAPAAASPAGAKPAAAVAEVEAEAELSYGDDFQSEEGSKAAADSVAASPSGAKPPPPKLGDEAEASYEDDFSGAPSPAASNGRAVAAEKAESSSKSSKDLPSDASRSHSDDRAASGEEADGAYDDDDFSKDGSSRSSSRSSTPSRRSSRKGSRSPSPASSRGSRGRGGSRHSQASRSPSPTPSGGSRGRQVSIRSATRDAGRLQHEAGHQGREADASYDDDDFSDAGSSKAPPSPVAPSSPAASSASRRQDNESYDVDDFDTPPASSRKPAPPLATHQEEEDYDDDDFASSAGGERSAPETLVAAKPSPAPATSAPAKPLPEEQEYDDDFSSATGAGEEEEAAGGKAPAPAPPATASTMPPSSALGKGGKGDLDSTFGSHAAGLESTAGSKGLDATAGSRGGLGATAPLPEEAATVDKEAKDSAPSVGLKAERSLPVPPPLKVSPELAQLMAERAAREREEAEARVQKEASISERSEAAIYEDDFDTSGSGMPSRSGSLASPPRSAPVVPETASEQRRSDPPSLAQLMAAKAGEAPKQPPAPAKELKPVSEQVEGKAAGEGEEDEEEAAAYDDDFEDFE